MLALVDQPGKISELHSGNFETVGESHCGATMYRLHIDVPCGTDQKEAIASAQQILADIQKFLAFTSLQGREIGVRLGCDEDRQKSNYLDLNENGHCSNKKTKITL